MRILFEILLLSIVIGAAFLFFKFVYDAVFSSKKNKGHEQAQQDKEAKKIIEVENIKKEREEG